jgi:hypothetical protein
MAREPAAYAKLPDDHGLKNRSPVVDRALRAILALMGIGIAYGFVASLGADGLGHASESAGRLPERTRDRHPVAPVQPPRVASTLDTLQRLPESVRTSLQATKTLSSKDVCRIAERLVQEPTVASIDTIAHYLSKDVRRWSDRMITLYLKADPSLAKAADKGEMKKRLLHKWESDRGMARRWLQGCGFVARAAIGRGRLVIEREAPEILADVVSVIATGLRKNEPDAIAAAEALARAEENLRASLK